MAFEAGGWRQQDGEEQTQWWMRYAYPPYENSFIHR